MLLDFIRSGNREKSISALRVLEGYRVVDPTYNLLVDSIYDLLKEAVKCSKGDRDIKFAAQAVIDRGGLTSWRSGIMRLSHWLQDEDQYVRSFARDLIEGLKIRIEFDCKIMEEIGTRRRKGL